ncbi:MAG: diacylglycerol kinase family protein [Chthoniobacteraceae bacterium]
MKPGPKSGFLGARMRSFACAGRGVALLLRSQVNARIHLLATVVVIAGGIGFGVTSGEWCLLAIAMGMVWSAEAANAALEQLADRVNHEHDERIGRAMDVAAGAVLLAAIAAAAVGFLVFGPRVWALLRGG